MDDHSEDHPNAQAFHILVFPTREAAEHAFEGFIELGVSPEHMSLLVHRDPPADADADRALDHDIDVGGKVGAGAASLAGGIGGLLTGLGLLVVPGFGPLLAVGPVAGALTGAITGGALGGFAGSLVGAGISEASALQAEKHLAAGRALVIVADAAWSDGVRLAAERSSALIDATGA